MSFDSGRDTIRPDLFDEIERIVNECKFETGKNYGIFILIGSHAYNLMGGITESVVGRVNIIEMSPLSMSEICGKEEKLFTIDIERISNRIRSFEMEPMELYAKMVCRMYPELYDNLDEGTKTF